MKLHRFYVGGIKTKTGYLKLEEQVWLHDEALLKQIIKVLRLRAGEQLVLFNGNHERLYEIKLIESDRSILLQLKTEINRSLPPKHVYLFWSVLKNEKNDWIVQKATEIGVMNFVPMISDRTLKTDINIDRLKKIAVEAAEQCGRFDVPQIREPISLKSVFEEYSDLDLLVCDQGDGVFNKSIKRAGILIGPEGGWTESENKLFLDNNLPIINIAPFTLRAETAAILAAATLMR